MKISALLAGAALSAALVSGAHAATYVMGTAYDNNYKGVETIGSYGQQWTTPETMTLTTNGVQLIVFCDDLQHDFTVGGTYDMVFTTVTKDGFGHSLTQGQSNKMGVIADLGRAAYNRGDWADAIAAQAAIWGVEYNVTPTSTDATIEADITAFLALPVVADGHWATGFVPAGGSWPNGGSQAQILGAPEASTWAMMGLGFAGLAVAGRRMRRTGRAIA